MATRRELLEEIETNIDEYIALLQRLIQAASPNPPGDTKAAAEVLTDYLSSHGISYDIIEPLKGAPNVVSSFSGKSGPRVILNGHIDTYPVENPNSWDRGPYSGYNDGKFVHGRGGVDMKSGTAASTIAYVLLHKRAALLNGSVALTAVSDEETGGKWGTKYLLEGSGEESPWKGDVVLNGEPTGLQSIRFGEKGTLRITFTVKTPGANGAYTHRTRGSNIVAALLIVDLLQIEKIAPDLPENLRRYLEKDQVRKVVDEIMGSGAADILIKPTVNIGTVHGGVKVNTIPEKCVFEADIRLPIGMLRNVILDRIDELLKKFPEASYQVQEAASNPANYCAADHPFAKVIEECTVEVTGRRPVHLAGLGGTDLKHYRYIGVPAYCIGPSPTGMGATGEATSTEEFISLIRIHTLAVWDFLTKNWITQS